jgi:hypothetical protein
MNFTLEKLKEARDAGISDEVIWNTAIKADQRFSQAKEKNIPLETAFGAYQQSLGQPTQPAAPATFAEGAEDIGRKFLMGGVGGIRSITNILGASNPLSKSLAGVEDYIAEGLSAESQGNSRAISELFQKVEEKGLWDKFQAGLEAFKMAPGETLAQTAGYMIPNLVAGLAGKAAQFGRAGLTAVQAGVGATMGAGIVKGEIYEGTYEYLKQSGLSEEEARKRADEAQASLGKNLDQIFLAAGLGAVASTTGAEKIITRMLSRTGKEVSERSIKEVLKAGLGGAAGEAVFETIQEGQEKVASNKALQREGADVDTFAGVPQVMGMAAPAAAILGGGAGAISVLSTPEQTAARRIERDSNQAARELSVPAGDTTGQIIVNDIGQKENEIANLKEALQEQDINSPQGQELLLAIRYAETQLNALKKQAGETVESEQARLAREIAAKSTTPAALSTEVQSGIRSGVASLDPDIRELYADQLTRKLEKKGKLTWQDVPQELNDAMDTIEFGALKQALDTNPQEAISIIAGKPAAPVSETITEPAAAEPAGIAVEPETQAKIAALKQGWTDRLAAIPEKNKRQKADAEAMIWNKQSSLDPVERQAAEEFFGERAKTEELGKLQEAMDAENNEKVDFDNARQLVESLTGETGAAIRALVSASPKLASALENIKVQSGSPSFDGSVIRIRRTDNTPQTKAHEATHAILDKAIDEVPAFRDGIGKIIKEFFEITDWNTRIFSEIPTAVRKKMEIVSKIYSQARTNYKSFGKNQDISFSKYFSDNLAFIVRSIQPSMKGYKITDQDVRFAYALTGQHEFLAAIMSDQEFRDFAKELKLYQKPKSLFERFIEAVKSLFGKKPIQAPVTQLDKVMKLVEEAINNEAYQPGPYKREYGRSFELPRKPAAEETGTTPESPEGQSVPAALANGIDIGPENNMPPARKIESHLKNFLFLRGFFQSASDRLRRNGFVKLGNAIDTYFDEGRRRIGDANKIMLAPLEAYEAAPAARRKKIEEDFQTFYAAQENGRDTDAIRGEMDPIAVKIVDAWQKFGEMSGKENQRVGVKVYDPSKGTWRKIGRVEKFWPRRLKPEYQRALMDPDKYAKEYNEIVEALLESGQIKDPVEAEKYLREYSPEATKNDYFSGIEKARGKPLPEKLYDYSMPVMTDYISRWAHHVSRIEQFGQKTTEDSKTLWDREMETTRDPRTRDYIQAARERVEGYFPNDPFLKGTSALNIWATGLQLGNPASAVLNLIGGSTLNAMIGQPGALGSYVASFAELRNLGQQMRDAKEKGVLGRDLMNIVGDHQAILETNGFAKAGQKTADFLLKWAGFTPAEQMIRTQSLIIGKSFVRNALNSFKTDPNGQFARRSQAWLSRNGFDIDKLIVEEGVGQETDRVLRYFSNIAQGSYTIDQVPIFIDMPVGRFLFKYQKFSTQVMRMSWKNTFEPLFKAMTGKGETIQIPDKVRQDIYRLKVAEARELGDTRKIDLANIPKTATKGQARALALIPAMMWLGSAYVGGEILLRMRDILFGVLMKGPDYEDMIKALEDDERAAALYLASERAWYNLIGIGALGLIGNYAQFFMDWQDRERVKNPLDPPALSMGKDTWRFIETIVDQGTVTAGDIDNYTRSTVSAYRSTKKLAESAAGFLGLEDIPGIKEEMFRREVASINKYARRWAADSGIEYRLRRPTEITATPRTPVNRKITAYLQTSQPQVAAAYAKAYLNTLDKQDRKAAIQSLTSSARNRQPLRLGTGPMDESERKAFLRWLKGKVSAEKYEKVAELDKQYQRDYKKFLRMLPNR